MSKGLLLPAKIKITWTRFTILPETTKKENKKTKPQTGKTQEMTVLKPLNIR